MAGPSGTGPGGSLSSALFSVFVLSSSEGSHDGDGKNLTVEAAVSFSTEHPWMIAVKLTETRNFQAKEI